MKARYTSTLFARPDVDRGDRLLHRRTRADAAAGRARPPGDRPTPRLRINSCSSLPSTVKVTMPSMSAGVRPASRIAARHASAASCISLRPDSLENSVAPMPATMVPVTAVSDAASRKNGVERAAVVAELHDHGQVVVGLVAARRGGSRPTGCLPPTARASTMRGASSGRFGCSDVIHDTIRPRPDDSAVSQCSEPQAPHIGAGGCRSVPQSAHRWITSRPSAAASQKNWSSSRPVAPRPASLDGASLMAPTLLGPNRRRQCSFCLRRTPFTPRRPWGTACE